MTDIYDQTKKQTLACYQTCPKKTLFKKEDTKYAHLRKQFGQEEFKFFSH